MMTEATVVMIAGGIAAYSLMCGVIGAIGLSKGRNLAAWFFAALFFSPPIALLMLIACGELRKDPVGPPPVPPMTAAERRQARRSGA